MDLKADDALNVDIDSALLLSYELEKLNLDNIPNDIFDQIKLTDEIPKHDDKIDAKCDFLLKDNKINESASANCTGIKTEKIDVTEDELCYTEIKAENVFEYSELKKDINGNEETISEENLNKLFDHLELSDSDNEEIDNTNNLKERGPLRPRRRVHKNKDANILWGRNGSFDRSQFDSERLRFLSGSSQVLLGESTVPNHYAVYNSHTTICNGIEATRNLSSQETYFEDTRASSVSSPESGYDSSSAHSITPPPVFTSSVNLDFIPETVDEQNILDFLIENTDSALIDNNLAVCNINDKDAEGKITEIINFLKDIPSELCESSNATAISHDILNVVPSPNQSAVLNISDVAASPILYSNVSKNLETPKKLVPKLKDEAKRALKTFLSEEEYFDAKKRIYEKIREDKQNGKKISVIFVEDEMDRDSKKRTNLHNAVLEGKIEEIFSIIEIHKQYDLPFSDINIRDKQGKTALDYAVQKEMTLVADYLKENTACQSVSVEK